MLNPQILKRSQVQDVDWESCHSVPDHGALVYRPQKVMVSYETLDGETVERTLEGNDARVFQHEYDHLDGILYTSRMIAKSFTHMDILKDDEAREAVEEHLHEKGALAEAQAEQQRLQERRAKVGGSTQNYTNQQKIVHGTSLAPPYVARCARACISLYTRLL